MTNIMVVDDEATITTQLEERLTSMGYKVVSTASSGKEAIKKARETNPDLILMDIVMPGKIDGIKAAKSIKKEFDIPVVFLTAYGDDQFIQRAKTVEPLGYIIKPYNVNELKAAIEIAVFNKKIFNQMKTSQKQWRTLAENIHEGIILADQKKRIFFWNKGAENIFGYSQKEVQGKQLDLILSEGTKKIYQYIINQLISSRNQEIYDQWVELVGVKKDWSRFPMEILLKVKELENNTYFICMVRDLTKQKKIESQMETRIKEKEIIIKDYQDRIKNNLSLIYRLLSMQLDLIKSKHLISKEKHYWQDFDTFFSPETQDKKSSTVNVSKYISSIITRLFKSYEVDRSQITLHVNIEKIYLNVRTAVLCGLLVSELVSNSIKHAFPEKKRGNIIVYLSSEDQSKYTLKVKDNGIGFPDNIDFKEPKSRGLEIVHDIASQLKGKMQIEQKGGTEISVTFILEE